MAEVGQGRADKDMDAKGDDEDLRAGNLSEDRLIREPGEAGVKTSRTSGHRWRRPREGPPWLRVSRQTRDPKQGVVDGLRSLAADSLNPGARHSGRQRAERGAVP